MYPAVDVIALILVAIRHVRDAFAIRFAIAKLGIVASSVGQIEHTTSANLIVLPITDIAYC